MNQEGTNLAYVDFAPQFGGKNRDVRYRDDEQNT
jgi:hypothetical protein